MKMILKMTQINGVTYELYSFWSTLILALLFIVKSGSLSDNQFPPQETGCF